MIDRFVVNIDEPFELELAEFVLSRGGHAVRPRKVCVVITARPSYARIRSVLEAIQAHPALELQLVVAASALLDRYGNAQNVIESEGFRIDRRVYMILEGENLVTSAKSTGLGMSEMATVLDDLKPDLVVTIADRFETMATAVAAAYVNLPLVHIQGGEVTGSIDEKVRHAVTKLADIHMVATERAAERVVRMGERPDRVFNTGCPSIDVARRALERPEVDWDEIFRRFGGVGPAARPLGRLRGRGPASGHDRVRGLPPPRRGDAARDRGERDPGALVLAQRRRGLRRHLQGDPRLPGIARPAPGPFLQEPAAGGLHPGAESLALHRRKLERRESANAPTWGFRPSTSAAVRRAATAGAT